MPSTRLLSWIMTVGGVAAIVAAFLPWLTVTVGSTFSTSGMEGGGVPPGVLAVILGAAVAAVGAVMLIGRRVDPVLTVGPPALLAVFAVIEFFRLNSLVAQANEDAFLLGVHARHGVGFWLLLASSLAAVTAAIVLLQLRRRASVRGQA